MSRRKKSQNFVGTDCISIWSIVCVLRGWKPQKRFSPDKTVIRGSIGEGNGNKRFHRSGKLPLRLLQRRLRCS